jgi:hypothetical protein
LMPKNIRAPRLDRNKPISIDDGVIDVSSLSPSSDKNTPGPITDSKDSKQTDDRSKSAFYISPKEIIVSIAVLIILVAIVVGISLIPSMMKGKALTRDDMFLANYEIKPTDGNFIYNNYSFLKLPDTRTSREFWFTQIRINNRVYDIPMHYNPKEVEDIPVEVRNVRKNSSYTQIYITVEPVAPNISKQYAALSIAEFSEKITKIKNIPLKAACTINYTDTCDYRPIIYCNSTEAKNDSLIFKFDDRVNDTKITIDDNCVIIEGVGENLIKATDKMLYLLIGIMK